MRSRGVLAGLFAIIVVVLAFVYVVATAKSAGGEDEPVVITSTFLAPPTTVVPTTVVPTTAKPTTTTVAPTTTTVVAIVPPPVAPPPVAPPPVVAPSPPVDLGSVWDRLAQCEAGGNWSINTGNGYSGGLQFHPQTWTGHGGGEFAPYAYQATREQQIVIAERVLASQGWRAWPGCTRLLGLR